MNERHRAVAAALLAQHAGGEPFRPLEEQLREGGLDAAYEIQEILQSLIMADRAVDIGGYKVALTSKTMQEMVGVDQPLAGAIFEDTVYRSPARLSAGRYQHLGIECEFALRLKADLLGRAGGHSRSSVAAAVGAVMPAFELIEDRNADYAALDAVSLVADNSWNAGIVLGEPVTDWNTDDLASARGRLSMNGKTVDEGQGADALGHPLNALAWLADAMAVRARPLQRGMIVMTGSIVKTQFPEPGDRLTFAVDGFGSIELVMESG